MKILYFARFRQLIGRGGDELELPAGVITAEDLMAYLAGRDEGCAVAFADRRTVKVAVDQVHAPFDASIIGAKEVAFFPPVTGG